MPDCYAVIILETFCYSITYRKSYRVIESLLHKFYAANISIGMDGSMLVSSTRERVLVWGMLFCLVAAAGLVTWLIYRKNHLGKLGMGCFATSLVIPVLVMPSVRHEYIHASPRAITIETGAWYRSSRTILDMTDIKNIRETDAQGYLPSNLIGDPNVHWHVTWLDGKSAVLELNDFFNAHRMVVAYYYKDRGYWLERLEDAR